MWDTVTEINSDIFLQNRVLPPDLQIRLVFWFNTPEFYLISPDPAPKYKIQILKSHLIVPYIDAAPGLTQSVNELLASNQAAKYFINYSKIKAVTVSKGDGSVSISDLYSSGSLPSELVFGFVREQSRRGSYQSNPFNFKHVNVTSIKTEIDEEPAPYSVPLLCNFKNNSYSEAYANLYDSTPCGIYDVKRNKCLIEKKDYNKGYTLFRVVFSKVDRNTLLPSARQGKLSLEVTFSRGLDEAHVLLVYAKFPAIVEIASSGQVKLQV